MLETAENDDERLLGAKCLWMLAFDESNQRLMTSNESFMVALYKLRASDNKEIQKAAAGALWEIEGRSKHAVNRGKTHGISFRIVELNILERLIRNEDIGFVC